ncbi:hypothetical protein OEA41_010780 [Lepraria neglecta]|uniref:Dienelactone hydrolase domain-containing protein n=1 Tax=Lepraria neglecta TaxID=209136 RepID=A0AAE0DI07_9LECA|nr:hypothetical protein OEA41_010780 [Lepraria neglecta]
MNQACCNVPPAVSKGYSPKGKYIDLNTTGPSHATSAIFIIYDIFGFSDQAIQGADILAHADAKSGHEYQVFMPDFFLGKPLSHSDYPPDTEEKQKTVGAFFGGPAAPPKNAGKVPGLVKEIEKQCSGIQKWGSLGMCWGGKIVSLTAQPGTNFSAAAEVHPAMVDPKDAKDIKIPVCMLASGDEDADAVKKFGEALSVPNHIETFSDQVHGWMAARADLENEKVKKEYERGYQVLLDFYHKHL